MNKKKKGRLWILMGLLMISAALFLSVYNVWDEQRAERASSSIVKRLAAEVEIEPHAVDYTLSPQVEMPKKELDGEFYIGILDIPALGLSLPVIDEWSYARLKIAPCRAQGSAYTGDLIIAAHNYDCHFGRLKSLNPEDKVIFTDMDGNIFYYKVAEMEVLEATAVEEMENGEWDLTLYTCTYGGESRVTIRCVEIK